MSLRSYGEQYEEVDNAIKALIAGAQRYEYGGRVVWKADLAELRREREHLRSLVNEFGYDTVVSQSQNHGAYGVSFV